MSDTGRKGVTDQLAEKATPESQKSTTDKASETVTNATDKVMGSAQPSDQKSTTQKATDSMSGSSGNAGDQGKSYLQQASDTVGNALGGNKK